MVVALKLTVPFNTWARHFGVFCLPRLNGENIGHSNWHTLYILILGPCTKVLLVMKRDKIHLLSSRESLRSEKRF